MESEENQAADTTPGSSDESASVDPAAAEGAAQEIAVEGGDGEEEAVVVRSPEYSTLEPSMEAAEVLPLDRFYDVNVPIWAELGRVKMPIGDILKLGQGSVLKLGRRVSEPVDLIAQGVRLARGEVVVVDDCFAVRIKEVEPAKQVRA